jgi:hypothetical protein
MINYDLYISGPMTGLPENNYPAFAAAAAQLRAAGFTVWSPHENGLPADASWNAHMRADIAGLMQCRAVALLPDWKDSKGAQLEVSTARGIGMRCYDLSLSLTFDPSRLRYWLGEVAA